MKKLPRTRYQRMSLAVDCAQAIQRQSKEPVIRDLAQAIVWSLAAPIEILKARLDYINVLVDKKED